MPHETYFVRYSFICGPGREIWRGATLEVNCQAWAHKILRERFGVDLPTWLLSKELLEDEKFTRDLSPDEFVCAGDIFLFGRKDATDMRLLHWAIATGYCHKENGQPILEHVNVIDKTVGLWPLSQFREEPRYERVFAIKRPIKLTY